MRTLFTLLIITIAATTQAQVTDTIKLPTNQYLFNCKHCGPYPLVNQTMLKAVTQTGMKNVLNFGAVGNGTTLDDAAIDAAFAAHNSDAASQGVYFPPNKTYLISKRHTIFLTKACKIIARNATIKMRAGGFYTMIELEYNTGDYYKYDVLWIGGKFDGNKDNQSYPGSPTGNNTDMESHGRMLGISGAKHAIAYGIHCLNGVMDNINIQSTKLAVIAHCKSTGSAFVNFALSGEQNTGFKMRIEARDTGQGCTAYFLRDTVMEGGAMSLHVSSPVRNEGDTTSRAVVNGCYVYNGPQNGFHAEDCAKVMIYNSFFGCDPTGTYNPNIHFSNRTRVAVVEKCILKNTWVNGMNAQVMRLGMLKNCKFTSEYNGSQLRLFVDNLTHVVNCSFTGMTAVEQTFVKNAKGCTFSNFGSQKAIRGLLVGDSNTFINGNVAPISFGSLNGVTGKAYRSTFINVPSSPNTTPPAGTTHLNTFKSEIRFWDDTNKFLGKVNAGI